MNAAVPLPEFLRAHADAHAQSASVFPGGKRWQARRRHSLDRVLSLGLPTQRDEPWKYTPLRLLARRAVGPGRVAQPTATDTLATTLAVPGARRLVFVDGRFTPALSDEPAGIDDLRIDFFADLLRATPDALLAHVPVPSDRAEDRFALLNDAFLADGVLIRVAAGATPAPLHLLFACTSGEHIAHPRVMLEVERGAHLVVIEQHLDQSDGGAIDNAVTHIDLRAGATLEHSLLVDAGARGQVLHGAYLTQHADSHLIHHRVLLGGEITRASLQARLDGCGAAIELNSLALAPGAQYADAHSVIEHSAPRTRSQERFRAAAGAGGRCVFNGRVVVQAGAAGSDSQQSSRGLLLAPGGEIDARPQLEIYTDDVKCSHGATTGRLDEDMLFYLLSRGLEPATARGLLLFAFLDDVIARMSLDAVRRDLEQRIAAALPDAPVIREFL